MDALVKTKRRKRYERTPTGRRITPSDYEGVWFQKLHEHGPLTTSYLYEYTKDLVPSLSTVKHRLGFLFHETDTPNGGAYLGRPVDQNRQAKHLEEIHENDGPAEEYLKAHGLIPHTAVPTKDTNFPHRFMASCITASIELGCRERGLTFVSGQELLARSPTGTLKLPATFSYKGRLYTIPIVPDGYFGIRYQDGSVRAFLVEADRGTEPIERADMENQRSYLRKILQYQSLLTRRSGEPPAYRTLLGIQSGLVVLNCTNNYRHMESMMAAVMRETERRGSTFMLFKPLPVFADKFAVPPVLTELLTTPWRRAGHAELDISKP